MVTRFVIPPKSLKSAVCVGLEVFDLGLKFVLLSLEQTGSELGQGGNDADGLIVVDLLKLAVGS